MDMRKVFDTIDLPALVQALRSRGLPEAYVSLLCVIYANQKCVSQWNLILSNPTRGQTGRHSQRNLFNYVLDVTFDEWTRSLDREDLYIAQ